MGIRLASGRLLTASDVEARQPVALVNERFVRLRLNGRSALGQTVTLQRLKDPPFNLANNGFQIVGVVHDTLNDGLADPIMPEVFIPFSVVAISDWVAVRTSGDPAALTRAVTSQVYAVDKGQPVMAAQTLDRLLRDNEYARPRFNLVLLSIFAALGLALAVVGVYGVMSTAVAQERQEIGVRLALGAEPATITRMMLARGARLLLAGTAIGLVGSFAVGTLARRRGLARGGIRSGRLHRGRDAADGGRPPGVLLARPSRGADRSADRGAGGLLTRSQKLEGKSQKSRSDF